MSECIAKWCVANNPGLPDSSPRDTWVFCPWCGKPRPKEKSLKEKVAEALKIALKADPLIPDYSTTAGRLADIAIKVINAEKY